MKKHYYLVLFFLVFNFAQAFAGLDPYQGFIKGALKVGDTLTVKDEKFRNSQFNWANITNISVKNRIELRILQEQAIAQNFDCQVQLKVEYYSTPEQVEPTAISQLQLNVGYRTGQAVTHKLVDHYAFTNGYLVKIYITNISSPQYGQDLPPVLQLTSSILIDRQYKFTEGLPFNLSGSLSDHQLKLEWDATIGAEEHDIEWTPIDDPGDFASIAINMDNGTTTEAQAESIFKNNATRITTDGQQYVISLLYNSAYVAVRIRQVSYDPVTGVRQEGSWNYKQADGRFAIWLLSYWHEDNLNWQYTAVYAEQGKKKEVVSYFDGTLRSRQTATLSSTEDIAIVQENVYDEFGRPFMSILPAPHRDQVSRQYLHYFPNFNLNNNSTPTSFNFSNIAYNSCGIYPLDSLSNVSGAAKYYSPQNPFPNSSYVPDAKNYPFSLTQYTADNTGRVQVQGGVGKIFQPGLPNNKATKYFYGKPEQWELDRIFGNDVGYAEHYLKQLVVDPNGQASVSYTNSKGQTIATALAGAVPQNLSALSSFTDAANHTGTFLKPEQFVYDPATKKFTASATYLATAFGNVKLRFNMNKLIDLYKSGPYHPCSNCHYTLKIKVVDDCNDVKMQTQNPIEIGSTVSDCTRTDLHTEEIDFSVTRLGEYYVSFEMSISNEVVESYVDNYIVKADSAGKLKKEFEFIKHYIDGLDFKSLFADCRTAVRQLGTRSAFTDMVKLSLKQMGVDETYVYGSEFTDYVDDLYTVLYTYVTSLEENCTSTPCDAVKSLLLADVSPGGQYALFDDQGNALEKELNILYRYFRTVFNKRGSSDPDYQANLVTLNDGRVISPYDADFNLTDLVTYWQPKWAAYFIDKHPEYCKLQACEANSTYFSWDEKLTEIFQKESDISRISTGLQYSTTNGHWLLNSDPFFNGSGATYKASMQLDLDQYTNRVLKFTGVPVKNLSQYVTYSLYCADSTSNINPNNANILDSGTTVYLMKPAGPKIESGQCTVIFICRLSKSTMQK
jgi:hypothetical protein